MNYINNLNPIQKSRLHKYYGQVRDLENAKQADPSFIPSQRQLKSLQKSASRDYVQRQSAVKYNLDRQLSIESDNWKNGGTNFHNASSFVLKTYEDSLNKRDPIKIKGKTSLNSGSVNNKEFENFNSHFSSEFTNGLITNDYTGTNGENEWDYSEIKMPNGDILKHGTDDRQGKGWIDSYTINYANRFGMDKVVKPQPIPSLIPRSKTGSKLKLK